MDVPSFGLGFFLGVLASLLALGGLLFVKVRRALRGFSFRAVASSQGPATAPQVATDAEGFILTTPEEIE